MRLACKERACNGASTVHGIEICFAGGINNGIRNGIVHTDTTAKLAGFVVARGYRVGCDAETVESRTLRNPVRRDRHSRILYKMLSEDENGRNRSCIAGRVVGFVGDLGTRHKIRDGHVMLLRRAQRNPDAICRERPSCFPVAFAVLAGGCKLAVAIDIAIEGKSCAIVIDGLVATFICIRTDGEEALLPRGI